MTCRSRTAQAVTTAALSAGCLLLLAGPAVAQTIGELEGEDRGPGLAPAATIALFVLLPALAMAVIGGLAWLPYLRDGARYRPQRGWDAPPVWFAGPADPVDALASAQVGDEQRGGAHGSW